MAALSVRPYIERMTRTTTSARRLGLWLGACVMVALFSLLLARVARADSMRCGKRIVATGEALHVVRALCGEPASARQRTEIRTERASADCSARAPGARCERDRWVRREVRIDEWTYDFGPRRLLQHLTFADGRLESIEAGGRGSQR